MKSIFNYEENIKDNNKIFEENQNKVIITLEEARKVF